MNSCARSSKFSGSESSGSESTDSASSGLELADIVRQHGAAFLARYGRWLCWPQQLFLKCVLLCRTAALGCHTYRCKDCGHEHQVNNSCQNRHCNKCQGAARHRWAKSRQKELLPVEYFHVVFTLPQPVALLGLQNPRLIYDLLFQAVSETLQEVAADPKRLGGQIGFLAVLHTWGQMLQHHPHIHVAVPGGALSADEQRWISCPRGFFLPVKVLSRKFRGKYLALLARAYRRGQLKLEGKLAHLQQQAVWKQWLSPLYQTDWQVYCKPPFGGPQQVLQYLARYTHRVAISNSRLVGLKNGQVTFRYKDYRKGHRLRTARLCAIEFLRRLVQHVLPPRFVRIRQYGFLAPGCRRRKLAQIRRLLSAAASDHGNTFSEQSLSRVEDPQGMDASHLDRCPQCGGVSMERVGPRCSTSRIEIWDMPWPWAKSGNLCWDTS